MRGSQLAVILGSGLGLLAGPLLQVAGSAGGRPVLAAPAPEPTTVWLVPTPGGPIYPAGTQVQLTATVQAAPGAAGSLDISAYDNPICTDPPAAVIVTGDAAAGPLAGLTSGTVGVHSYRASYAGDLNHAPSRSVCLKLNFAGLRVDPHPSGFSPLPAGLPLLPTSILEGTMPGASGTVTYQLFRSRPCRGTPDASALATVGGGVVGASGPLVPPGAGTYYLQAGYSGDGANPPLTAYSEVGCPPLTWDSTGFVGSAIIGIQVGTPVSVGSQVTGVVMLADPSRPSSARGLVFAAFAGACSGRLADPSGAPAVAGGQVSLAGLPQPLPFGFTAPAAGAYAVQAYYTNGGEFQYASNCVDVAVLPSSPMPRPVLVSPAAGLAPTASAPPPAGLEASLPTAGTDPRPPLYYGVLILLLIAATIAGRALWRRPPG